MPWLNSQFTKQKFTQQLNITNKENNTMKKFFIPVFICILFFSNLVFGAGQHTIFFRIFNQDGSTPGSITFNAYIQSRPNEILTVTSPGCGYGNGYYGSGYAYVQSGNFPTPWQFGDILVMDVVGPNGSTGSGTFEYVPMIDMADPIYLSGVTPPPPPSNDPIAFYPFNGNANDESSNGNNGSANGAILTTDCSGTSNSAYSFDGINDEIFISTTQTLDGIFAGPHSVSIWVFLDRTPDVIKFAIDYGRPGTDQRGIRFSSYNTQPIFKWHTNHGSFTIRASSAITLNQWHHIVGVFDGSQGKIYVDANLQGTHSSTGNGTTIDRMKIGQISGGGTGDGCFPGDIDEVRIYNRALSTAEVAELYTPCNDSPPEITVTVNPEILWPPNHKMVNIAATVNVEDDFDPNPDWHLLSITSNESEYGPGKKSYPDIIDAELYTEDTNFHLRAERLGDGTGRIYTITYEAIDESGNSTTAEAYVTVPYNLDKRLAQDETPFQIDSFELFANYPNPFNSGTDIRYQLPETEFIEIKIFNELGREIRSLINKQQNSSFYSVHWDGKDNYGNLVASGLYFYQMKAGKFISLKKMTLMK